MMLRHVVLFRWREGTTPAQVKAIEEALGGLPDAIPELRAYEFGSDIRVNDGNYDFVVVADFHDTDDYLQYRDHPLHQQLIVERIRPCVADRAAVQFEIS